jgi:hypothetical protein
VSHAQPCLTKLRWLWRALLTIATALLCFLLGNGIAQAFTNGYCGVLINAGSWCGDGSNHSYYYNRASYGGTGSVTVCERLLIADTSYQRLSPFCAINYAARNYGSSGCCYEAEVTHINSGGARHTISGLAEA